MSMRVSSGFLLDDVPYLRLGSGPPLVMVTGLTPDHEIPRGSDRRMLVSTATPLARDFTVYVVNRRRGLAPGSSMSDIAGHVAAAIEDEIGEAVFLTGTSTGGSVVLQLAIDRPELVRRLVVVSSAYRLGARGHAVQAQMIELLRERRAPEAWASLTSAMLPASLRAPGRPLSWLAGRAMAPQDSTDALITLEAEDAFDVEPELHRVTAPTLVVGGAKDAFYSEEMFRRTAAGVPDGRTHVFPTWGHVRTSGSAATAHLTLGFMLAGTRGPAPAGGSTT
jgi:pimeloyl-ACP methyl ester carboxylesterase